MDEFINDEEDVIRPDESLITTIIKKCKKITRWFNSSPRNANVLKREIKARHLGFEMLIQCTETRWNSVYFMLSRIYAALDCVNLICGRVHNNLILLTPHERSVLPDLINCLKPFEAATRELSAQHYVSVTMIIPTIGTLLDDLGELREKMTTQVGKDFLNKLIKRSIEKLGIYETRTCSA